MSRDMVIEAQETIVNPTTAPELAKGCYAEWEHKSTFR